MAFRGKVTDLIRSAVDGALSEDSFRYLLEETEHVVLEVELAIRRKAGNRVSVDIDTSWRYRSDEAHSEPLRQNTGNTIPKPDRELGICLRKVANRYDVKWSKLYEIALEQNASREEMIWAASWALAKDIQPHKTFYDAWQAAFTTVMKGNGEL